jgi:hypothetical protein
MVRQAAVGYYDAAVMAERELNRQGRQEESPRRKEFLPQMKDRCTQMIDGNALNVFLRDFECIQY